MRLRKRAIGLLVGAGTLFFLGTNVQAGWLFVLAALLLGVTIAGIVAPARAARGVGVRREGPSQAHQGDEVLVDVVVLGGRATSRGLFVHDPFLEPTDLWIGSLRPGERMEVTTLRVARRRGVHPAGDVSVRTAAPFGVAERRRSVGADGGETIVVPAVEPLGPLPFIRPSTTTEAAIHTAPRRGQGPEYLGIREYRAGDSMRHVHWASTARTGALMVRELEQEQTRRLAIVLDASGDGDVGTDGFTILDRVCSAAASIALASMSEGHGIRVVIADDDGGLDVLTRADRAALLDRLALVEARRGAPPFAAVVSGAAELLRGVECAVLVFPTWTRNDAEHLTPAVATLADRIGRVVAVPVVAATDRGAMTATQVEGLGQRLRATGVDVHPWGAGATIAEALGADPGLGP